ncbi:ABC transporter permease [Flammeovirgaceae bacterium]
MDSGTIIIEKKSKLKLIDWKELSAYRDLLYFLIVRGIRAKYAQSVLGVGWAVIQPLFTTLVFTIVFGRLAKIDSDGVPYALFSFCGLMAWTYFSGALLEASGSLVANASMLSKVYFPRIILPLAGLTSKLLDFGITIIVMTGLLLYFNVSPGITLIYFPLMVLLLVLCTAGPAILLAAWSVQYRDVKHAMTFMVQILMYAAPVVYPLSSVPKEYRLVYAMNPLVGVIEGFRSCILNVGEMPWQEIIIGSCVSFFFLLFALYVFSILEKSFADVA